MKKMFLSLPYIRNYLVRCAVIVETFETSTTWDNFEAFHENVLNNTQAAINEVCGKGIVMWRFTHVYPSGPTIYYSVAALGKRGKEIDQWDAIKKVASDTIIHFGGPITHHHAVGRDHRPWFEKTLPDLYDKTLRQLKTTYDPEWILNPDVLISRDKA